ncbi:MAG TPA: hypothetical protein VGL89_14510 [Candidatus Koribacter sp.]|jgi:hypothetical protein
MDLLRSTVASLWPQKTYRWWYPTERTALAHGTAISGFLEFVIFGYLESQQFAHHFALVANHFASANEGTQLAAIAIQVVAELFYPLSFVCIFLAFEGFIRFVAGAIVHEAVPDLPLTLAVRLWLRYIRKPRPA